MRVLTFTFFRATVSFRVFEAATLLRVLFSRLMLTLFYSKLNGADRNVALEELGIDSRFLPHLTIHSLRNKLLGQPLHHLIRAPINGVLVFQSFAPRFGNHIISLILLHHLTKDAKPLLKIALAK